MHNYSTLSLRHAVGYRIDEVLEWKCLDVSHLLGQKLLKAPMDLGEHALAVVASRGLCSAVWRNPVAVCGSLVRGNKSAWSLPCSATQTPPGVPSTAPTFTCLPTPGVQESGAGGVQQALGGPLCHLNPTCSQGSCDAVLIIHLEIRYKNYCK